MEKYTKRFILTLQTRETTYASCSLIKRTQRGLDMWGIIMVTGIGIVTKQIQRIYLVLPDLMFIQVYNMTTAFFILEIIPAVLCCFGIKTDNGQHKNSSMEVLLEGRIQ